MEQKYIKIDDRIARPLSVILWITVLPFLIVLLGVAFGVIFKVLTEFGFI